LEKKNKTSLFWEKKVFLGSKLHSICKKEAGKKERQVKRLFFSHVPTYGSLPEKGKKSDTGVPMLKKKRNVGGR